MDIAKMKDLVISSLEEKNAKDIDFVDVKAKSSLADYFVIATAKTTQHIDTLVEHLSAQVEAIFPGALKSVEGKRTSTWVLIDLGDIVVHLFTEKDRDYYKLERIWQKYNDD